MPARERRFPKIIREDEIQKINETIINSKMYSNNKSGIFLRWRDLTCIHLLIRLGLRPLECVNLKWKDIDFENRLVYIDPLSNKVRNNMPAILTRPAEEIIIRYQRVLKEMGIQSEYLFPSYWSWKPITRAGFSDRYRKILKEAGILKFDHYDAEGKIKYNYNMYSGRHKFATDVYSKTRDTTAVKELCRHTQLLSAQFYIHLDEKQRTNIADDVFK